jgi:TRAP-type C4-dicarboxylate transport system permease small subunit
MSQEDGKPEGAAAEEDALEREAHWEPNFPRIRRLDSLWYSGERAVCGVMFLAMSLMVFAAVVSDIFGTRRSLIDVVGLLLFCFLGTRTYKVKEGKTRPGLAVSAGIAVGLTAAIAGVVALYIHFFPGGFVWAQKLALVMMLWVALLGASMATYERAHLALELGEKLWPKKVIHFVNAFAHAVTSFFTLALFVFSIKMAADHFGWGTHVEANMWLPAWVAVLIMPYTFLAMTVRLLAQTYTLVTRSDAPVEEQLPT